MTPEQRAKLLALIPQTANGGAGIVLHYDEFVALVNDLEAAERERDEAQKLLMKWVQWSQDVRRFAPLRTQGTS